MYLDFLVKIPSVKGKITIRNKKNIKYIEYQVSGTRNCKLKFSESFIKST